MTTEIDGVDLDALNYTELLPYNGTGKQGANPLDFDVNLWYQVGIPPSLSGSSAHLHLSFSALPCPRPRDLDHSTCARNRNRVATPANPQS
jgi:hypothetical protein